MPSTGQELLAAGDFIYTEHESQEELDVDPDPEKTV
jgi:hypothetical protein